MTTDNCSTVPNNDSSGGSDDATTVLSITNTTTMDTQKKNMSSMMDLCEDEGSLPKTMKCVVTTCLTVVGVTTVLLLATLRHPLYSFDPENEQGRQPSPPSPARSLYVYSSGVACFQQTKCSSLVSSSIKDHCKPFPFVNNCAEGHLLSLQSVRLTLDLTLMCLSLFVILFIGGNVFNLIPHNAAVSRRLLAAASAFLFANVILSVALLHAGHCGQTPDKVVSLKSGIFEDLHKNGNDIPLTASLNVAPFYSLAAAILLGLSAIWYNNIEARVAQMTSASQSKLIYGELVVCGVCVLLCVTPCH